MTDIEAKALELDLIARVIGAYHATLLSADAYEHVLRSPFVRDGLDRLNAAYQSTTEVRHAAELREQAERFSEVAKIADQVLDSNGFSRESRARYAIRKFIIPAPDPLVEVLNGMFSENAQSDAKDLRAAIEARGGKIVWEAGE